MTIRPFHPGDQEAVVDLWARSGLVRPWNDPRKDIARKLRVQPELFLVADPAARRRGLGRALMAEAERLLRQRGCPKINLQVRADNREALAFYERIGFAQDAVASLGKRLENDESA